VFWRNTKVDSISARSVMVRLRSRGMSKLPIRIVHFGLGNVDVRAYVKEGVGYRRFPQDEDPNALAFF
jgi:hypothetical protein